MWFNIVEWKTRILLITKSYFSIFQITIHTDTLNESACVEQSIEAFKVNYTPSIVCQHQQGGKNDKIQI